MLLLYIGGDWNIYNKINIYNMTVYTPVLFFQEHFIK